MAGLYCVSSNGLVVCWGEMEATVSSSLNLMTEIMSIYAEGKVVVSSPVNLFFLIFLWRNFIISLVSYFNSDDEYNVAQDTL